MRSVPARRPRCQHSRPHGARTGSAGRAAPETRAARHHRAVLAEGRPRRDAAPAGARACPGCSPCRTGAACGRTYGTSAYRPDQGQGDLARERQSRQARCRRVAPIRGGRGGLRDVSDARWQDPAQTRDVGDGTARPPADQNAGGVLLVADRRRAGNTDGRPCLHSMQRGRVVAWVHFKGCRWR